VKQNPHHLLDEDFCLGASDFGMILMMFSIPIQESVKRCTGFAQKMYIFEQIIKRISK
jgi:hypothetical protein